MVGLSSFLTPGAAECGIRGFRLKGDGFISIALGLSERLI